MRSGVLPETVMAQSLYEAFARGYVQDEIDTGVLTLARTPHLVHCHLLATEPWLRTPKATSVTLYPLAGSDARCSPSTSTL